MVDKDADRVLRLALDNFPRLQLHLFNGQQGVTLAWSQDDPRWAAYATRRDADAKLYRKYTLVLYGDVNGDGKISLVDLLRVQKHLLNTSRLSGAYKTAADVSKDGSLTILDLLRVQKHLLGTTKIKQ